MVNNLTFSEAVRRICNIHGDVEAKTFTRVATAATVAMKQLRLHVMPLIKTERGTLDASLSWKFPADFSIFTKSGLLCDDGSIKIFGQSNAIDPETRTASTCTCDGDKVETTPCPACTFHNVMDTTLGFHTNMRGYRTPQFVHGRYKVDYKNRRIFFSGNSLNVGDQIIVEYNATEGPESIRMIPESAFLMVLHKTNEIYDSWTRPSAAHSHAKLFKKEYDAFKRLVDDTSYEHIIAALRGNINSAPRR
jgi:hypothetical protein